MPTPIVFFGSGAFGLPTLQRLASEREVLAVVSQPDRPAGRGGHPTPTPIASWTQAHLPGIPLLKPERIGEASMVARVRTLARAGSDAPASLVVIAFGQKIPAGLLDGLFAINLHASLLPRWRGAAPINAAILAGDTRTGNSVITLANRMDAGLVLAQSEREIDPGLTAGELHDLLSADGPDLVLRVLAEHESGTLRPATQDESQVTRADKLSRDDGWVDFSDSPELCRRRIHALTPWPGVTVSYRTEGLKPLRVRAESDPTGSSSSPAPGTILDPREGTIACGSGGVLRILEVQPAGKRPMTWQAFANGKRVLAGERLEGRAT